MVKISPLPRRRSILLFKLIHQRQGILRSLCHEFGLPDWTLTKGLSVLLHPFVPASAGLLVYF